MSGIFLAEPTPPRHRGLFQVGSVVLGAVFFTICALQLGLQSAYAGRIYPGVEVSNVMVGNLTRDQAARELHQRIGSYRLTVAVGDKHYHVTTDELGASYDVGATVEAAYLTGRDRSFVPLGMWQATHRQAVGYAYTLDTTTKQHFVDRIVAETGQAPVDATVVVSNGVPQIQPDKNGQALNADELARRIDAAVASGKTQTIIGVPSTQPAHVRANDTTSAVESTKQFIAVPISLKYQDKTFVPTSGQIGEWLKFEPSSASEAPGLKVSVDAGKVKDYILQIATRINKSPVNHKVNVMNGVTTEVQAGQDGLIVDDGPITQQLADAVTKRTGLSGAEIPTKPVAFKTEYNRTISLDYGRYIEVNLSQQHLWVYQDHNVIFDSPLTSGATGAGYPTVTGLFSIQAKQTNRNLNGYAIGYNYNVFVQYWMPFYGNYGLHDASWRSAFGGSDYYYGGSHGCVNLPLDTAAFIFNWADVGTPVWVHT